MAFGGETGREALVVVSRFKPVVTLPILNTGAVAVTVNCVYCAEVLYPAGVAAIATTVVPAELGWNVVGLPPSPPLNTIGLNVMLPTLVFELVTGTLIGPSPGLTKTLFET
jgi:hypothetical protein